jgi:hypothetical protein
MDAGFANHNRVVERAAKRETALPHHVHALVSRGGWTCDDRFLLIPYVDPHSRRGCSGRRCSGSCCARSSSRPSASSC